MAPKAASIDEYLAGVSADQRPALDALRAAIREIVPDAEECISYGLPAFRVRGKAVAGFGAAARHCSYFPMSGATIAALGDDLRGYDTSKGAVRFRPESPLPEPLLRKLIETRLREVAG